MTDTPALRRSFRLVCNPGQIPSVEALLSAQGFVFEPEPFSPLARRLLQEPFPARPEPRRLLGVRLTFRTRSSMPPAAGPRAGEGAPCSDMCASPGSKTGLLAQLVGREGLVLGNEPARPRLATLRRNLAALNLLQAVTCSWPGESLPLPDASWDAVLLDPPCSGWGTTDKNPQADQALAGRPPQTHAGSAAQAPDGSEPPAAPRRKARLFNLHNQCGRERGASPFCR